MSDAFPHNDPRHGTYAGSEAHKRHGVPKCEPCKEAAKLYIRERRRKHVSGSRFTFPIAMNRAAYDLNGLGLVIARAIRESA